MLLTGRVIGPENEYCGGAVELVAGVEDHVIRWNTLTGHSGCHVTSWAVDDKVAKERLALPESAVIGFVQVELMQAIEELLLHVGEQSLEVRRCTLSGQHALVAEGESLVIVAVDQQWDFGEIAFFPFVAGQVTNDIAVYVRAVVGISVAVCSE